MKKRCFVVMGFGIKTDYATGRKLDLNKSYRLLIKPVVEAKGVECVRADEIRHSGTIDLPMYQELLNADVVIADLSTANVNAFYELGIRHALRPFTTIVISENKLVYPFDLNHIKITSYTHLGDAIDYEEVERFRIELGNVLQEVLDKQEPDSPVYTYLNQLVPPSLKATLEKVAKESAWPEASTQQEVKGKALSLITEEAETALANSKFVKAKGLFESALIIGNNESGNSVVNNDSYLVQRLALTTYKAQLPDKITALNNALELLGQLDLAHTNDPETVSQAGAIEKKLYEAGAGIDHLNDAILYFQRGYYLLNNRYNAINLAYSLNLRADSTLCTSTEEVIADLIYANYTRKRVLYLCDKDWADITKREATETPMDDADKEERQGFFDEQKFWILINKAEAHFGLGEFENYKKAKAESAAIEHYNWMMEAFDGQIGKLRTLLQAQGHLLNPKWEEKVE